nr:hypothetical protein [Micromonospora sp. DSM 115978]
MTWGVAAAVLQKIRPKPVTFKVTPKGDRGVEKLPLGLLRPYVAVAVVAYGAAIVGSTTRGPVGYVVLCLISGTSYLVVIGAVSYLHAVEISRAAQVKRVTAARTVTTPVAVAGLLLLLGVAAGASAWSGYAETFPGLVESWITELR